MGLEVLVPVLVGALLRVAGKVGDGVLSAVEEQSKQAANGVVAKLRAWWSRDKVASDELERFQAGPDVAQAGYRGSLGEEADSRARNAA